MVTSIKKIKRWGSNLYLVWDIREFPSGSELLAELYVETLYNQAKYSSDCKIILTLIS